MKIRMFKSDFADCKCCSESTLSSGPGRQMLAGSLLRLRVNRLRLALLQLRATVASHSATRLQLKRAFAARFQSLWQEQESRAHR